MTYQPTISREQIVTNFLEWCDKIGFSGKDGVKVIIDHGLPIAAERSVQNIRFDRLTKGSQNTTME